MPSCNIPSALRPGDEIALVAPASRPARDWVDWSTRKVESWGLRPRVGSHVLDRMGFLAGTDDDRLADVNSAIRNSRIRAIVSLRGGCGSLRLVRGIDVDALRRDPKPLVGFSDITALHGVWHQAGVTSLHGSVAGDYADDVRTSLTGSLPGPWRSPPAGRERRHPHGD